MEVKCSRAPGAGSTTSQEKALPTGWRSEQLGPHVDIRSGESPSLFSFQTTGIPYFKVEQLNGANKYLSETPYFINVERPVAAGSIIFPKRGASILLNKIRLLRTPGYMDTNLMSLTPREAIYGEYLFYWLDHKGLAQFADVTSIPQINNKHIAPLRVQFPEDTEEQRKIAEALADADALIDSLEQLLAKKRQIKQGAMQELLTGKRRLPGFEQRWNKVKVRQLGAFLKGSGIKREEALSGDLPCVRYGELYTAHSDHVRSFSSWISPAVASSATLLRNGDLLFAGSGETKEEIGKCAAFLDEGPAYAGGDIVILRPTVDADSMFLGYLLNTPSVVRQKASKGQGDAVVHISANALGEVEVMLPQPPEQAAIARVLFDMDTELAAIESRLTKARALKQAMAQALLTGRIRLVEPTA